MVKNGINHIQIPLPANKEVVRMSQCQMSHALGVLLDRGNHPMLIHCNKGKVSRSKPVKQRNS